MTFFRRLFFFWIVGMFGCLLSVQAMQRGIYNPALTTPFRLSRTKLEMFLNCPRCFYLNLRFGVRHPGGFPFTLNNTVDLLLKKEFDFYRARQIPHPFFEEKSLPFIPFDHPDINKWRDSLHHGVQYLVLGTNIIFFGGIDDVWFNTETEELIVVDYKATSKSGKVSLDADWQIAYKRQVEIYQWLLRKNGFKVSNIAYFVYCNAKKDSARFDGRLDFDISLIPYEGDDSWIDRAIMDAYYCLQSEVIPLPSDGCQYCKYGFDVWNVLMSCDTQCDTQPDSMS